MDRHDEEKMTHEIRLEQPVLIVKKRESAKLTGIITNTSRREWCTDQAQPMRVKVGARLFRMAEKKVLLECRSELSGPSMRTMATSEFALEVDCKNLDSGVYTLVVDAVHEGRFWFVDRGARDHLVRVVVTQS
jgi:hypothetical protein